MDAIRTLVTEREDSPSDGAIAHTPQGEANLVVVTQTWWAQVLIRGGRSYLQNVLGYLLAALASAGVAHAAFEALAANGVDVPMPSRTFLTLLLAAMSAAIGPTVVCLIQNAIELLAKLDVTNPTLRA